ncbi:hypothetical protein Mgra_00000765 [Meloidogyne graminicola]|uniref:Uncharacterized protein n=1 Tax=Meloidogyne graminicola TaxID=189291 RepID=A0A8T0A380_9BILA|nr:hypothetical protein Mgra_00000765 [Meloidogyne graminicola]
MAGVDAAADIRGQIQSNLQKAVDISNAMTKLNFKSRSSCFIMLSTRFDSLYPQFKQLPSLTLEERTTSSQID